MATADNERERAIRERLAARQEAGARYAALTPEQVNTTEGRRLFDTWLRHNPQQDDADIRYLLARVDELTRDLAATREALRPFAALAGIVMCHEPLPDDRPFMSVDDCRVTYGDLRQAAALASARDRGDDADGEAG